MIRRYSVYITDKLVAVIHAESAVQAIELACHKTSAGYDPAICRAIATDLRGRPVSWTATTVPKA